jgi:hypothetical protein
LPWHPSGRGVDFLRSCYTTKIRPYSDSNDEVQIRWFFVDETTRPVLGFPTAFVSRNWLRDKTVPHKVGEVIGDREWADGSKPLWVTLGITDPVTDDRKLAVFGGSTSGRKVRAPVWCVLNPQLESGHTFVSTVAHWRVVPGGDCVTDRQCSEPMWTMNPTIHSRFGTRHGFTATVAVHYDRYPSFGSRHGLASTIGKGIGVVSFFGSRHGFASSLILNFGVHGFYNSTFGSRHHFESSVSSFP